MDDTKKIEYKLIPNKETLDLFLKKNFKNKIKKVLLINPPDGDADLFNRKTACWKIPKLSAIWFSLPCNKIN